MDVATHDLETWLIWLNSIEGLFVQIPNRIWKAIESTVLITQTCNSGIHDICRSLTSTISVGLCTWHSYHVKCDLVWENRSYRPCQQIQFFIINRMVHEWNNKFHNQNKLHFSGLLLLAAFLKHSGDLYKRSDVQMEAWLMLGWLWVAALLCGVE